MVHFYYFYVFSFLAGAVFAQVQDQWLQVRSNVNSECIALNPLDNNMIYTLTTNNLIVSSDRGVTWETRGTVPIGSRKSMVISPADTSIIILHSNVLLRSTDGGFNFTEVLPVVGMNGETLAFDPLNPQTVYVADFLSGDFYASEDAGATWALRSNLGTPVACSIAPHPTIPGLIIAGAGGGRIARSTDFGNTWTLARQEDTYTLETPKVEWDPSNPNLAYASTFAGVYSCFRSTDRGATWKNAGPLNIGMWGMQPNPVNGNVYIGTLAASNDEEGMWASYNNGLSFQKMGQNNQPSFIYVKMIKVANDGSIYILNDVELYRVDPQPYGSIEGAVLDSSGVRPLLLADIGVVETDDFLAVNNEGGSFEMHLPPGTYTLQVQTSGAVTVEVPNVQVAEGQTTNLDVIMPVSRQLSSLQGIVTEDIPFPLAGEARLFYKNEVGFRVDKVSIFDETGVFQLDSLSTLDILDSLVITPETLPLLPYTITNVTVDSIYNIPLQRADVLISAKDAVTAQETRFYLNRQGITSSVQTRETPDRDFSPLITSYVNVQTLVWVGEEDGNLMTPSALDSLERSVMLGQNLLMSGQAILEENAQESFFSNTLMINYEGNYSDSSPLMRGFSGNAVADNLLFAVGNQQQPSRDIFRSSHPSVHNTISYGGVVDDTSRVGALNYDNTGFGGRAVIAGFDITAAPSSIADSLFSRVFNYFGMPVGVEGETPFQLIETPVLYQNYPNPFNPSTNIKFYLPGISEINLTIYDMLGRRIRTLETGVKNAGLNRVDWDGSNENGEAVSSGVYIYRLQTASGLLFSRKMLLIR